jgi:hypothetical protein
VVHGATNQHRRPPRHATTTCHDGLHHHSYGRRHRRHRRKRLCASTHCQLSRRFTSIHIARQSLRTPFHTIPYQSCLAKERTSCRLLPEPPKHEFCIFCRSFSSKHCFANWDTDSNTKDILGQVYL